ncbi:hypothetical protein GCM10020331_023830 [Ectobacillus funiculus]
MVRQKKLASETNTLLSSMDAVLQTVADQAAYHSGKEMQEDVAALMDSREPYFNSVFIVDQK